MERVVRIYNWNGDFLGYAIFEMYDFQLTYELTCNIEEATRVTIEEIDDVDHLCFNDMKIDMEEMSYVCGLFQAIFENV